MWQTDWYSVVKIPICHIVFFRNLKILACYPIWNILRQNPPQWRSSHFKGHSLECYSSSFHMWLCSTWLPLLKFSLFINTLRFLVCFLWCVKSESVHILVCSVVPRWSIKLTLQTQPHVCVTSVFVEPCHLASGSSSITDENRPSPSSGPSLTGTWPFPDFLWDFLLLWCLNKRKWSQSCGGRNNLQREARLYEHFRVSLNL